MLLIATESFQIFPAQGKRLQFNTLWLQHAGSNDRPNNLKITSTQTSYTLGDLARVISSTKWLTDEQTRFASDLGVCMQSITPQKRILIDIQFPWNCFDSA